MGTTLARTAALCVLAGTLLLPGTSQGGSVFDNIMNRLIAREQIELDDLIDDGDRVVRNTQATDVTRGDVNLGASLGVFNRALRGSPIVPLESI